jgi:Generalcontrol nonderepressible 1 (Gcn1) N-terminal
LTTLLNCAKSTNAVVRAGSEELWGVVATRINEEQSATAYTEIIGPLAAGKTSGVDHRITLFRYLASLSPSNAVSCTLVAAAVPLLIKETNDAAVSALVPVIPRHIAHGLNGDGIDSATLALVCKELVFSKVPLHKALVTIVGETFWSLVEQDSSSISPAAIDFAKAVAPPLEKNLHTFIGSPLTSAFGVNDGYVSVTLLCLFAKSFNQCMSAILYVFCLFFLTRLW